MFSLAKIEIRIDLNTGELLRVLDLSEVDEVFTADSNLTGYCDITVASNVLVGSTMFMYDLAATGAQEIEFDIYLLKCILKFIYRSGLEIKLEVKHIIVDDIGNRLFKLIECFKDVEKHYEDLRISYIEQEILPYC